MKLLTVEKAAEVTGGRYVGPETGKCARIESVVRDNREVTPGALFVCIRGERVDGHDFAPAAWESGAVCCLCEHEPKGEGPFILVPSATAALRRLAAYYRSLFTIPVIGVIGSVGKTTAKEMAAAVLSARFNTYKTPKNLNNDIGVPLSLLQMGEEHEMAVIEMGISDFGEMTVLAEMVRPTACIFTNIGYCHLEQLGDTRGVLRAKSEVFPYMPRNGLAVVNGDDELLRELEPGIPKCTFGFGEQNDFIARDVENRGEDGVDLTIAYAGGSFRAHIPGYGSHLPLAALPAAALGKRFGLSDEEITAGLGAYTTVEGRSRIIDTGYIRIIDDCYNANPNSVTAAILSLTKMEGRKVAILGDMKELGRQSRELHRGIGALAGEKLDCLICCGGEAENIYKGLIAGGSETEAWQFPLKDALLSVLPSLIRKGDNVLVKASHSMHFEELTEELKKLR